MITTSILGSEEALSDFLEDFFLEKSDVPPKEEVFSEE